MAVTTNNIISFLQQYHIFDENEKELISEYFMEAAIKKEIIFFIVGMYQMNYSLSVRVSSEF